MYTASRLRLTEGKAMKLVVVVVVVVVDLARGTERCIHLLQPPGTLLQHCNNMACYFTYGLSLTTSARKGTSTPEGCNMCTDIVRGDGEPAGCSLQSVSRPSALAEAHAARPTAWGPPTSPGLPLAAGSPASAACCTPLRHHHRKPD